MKSRIYFLLLLLSPVPPLLTTGCDRPEEPPRRSRGRIAPPGTGAVKPVARIEDQVITRAQLARMVNTYSKNMIRQDRQLPVNFEETVLDLMIEGELLYQAGLDLKIEDLEAEIDQETRRIIDQFPSETAFADSLARRGMSVGMLREELKRKVVVNRVLAEEIFDKIEISDEKIEEYYNNHPQRFAKPLEQSREEIAKILTAEKTPELLGTLIKRLKEKYQVVKIGMEKKEDPGSGAPEPADEAKKR